MAPVSSDKTTRVAIVGGGIGGLTCALALGDCKNLEVSVYEAASELTQKGAGITFWARIWEMLTNLGLDSELNAILDQPRNDEPGLAFQFRKADQEPGINFYDLILTGGPLSLLRAEFQQVLLKHISPACQIYLSHRLVDYTEYPTFVHLRFHDGSTATCDVLIAADGIKSVARQKMLGDSEKNAKGAIINGAAFAHPIWSGSVAYRGLVSSAKLKELVPDHRVLTHPVQYWGKNKHLIVYPLSQGRLVNVVAFSSDPSKEGTTFNDPWVTDVSKDEMLGHFEHWESEVRLLLQCIENPSRWAIHALRPLESYVSDRVALLGDAAHAMTPHQGAGAGQAIEDAYILAALLRSPTCSATSIPRILEVYNSIRQPFGNRVQSASRTQGLIYEFNSPGLEHVKPGDKMFSASDLSAIVESFLGDWEWQWMASAEPEKERALGMLRGLI